LKLPAVSSGKHTRRFGSKWWFQYNVWMLAVNDVLYILFIPHSTYF